MHSYFRSGAARNIATAIAVAMKENVWSFT